MCQNGQTRIAAHRGTFGGNIIQNTIAAFDNALLHGADIIELDVVLSKDGVFYIFHDGYEKEVLGINQHLKHLTSAQIDQLVCTNAFEQASGVGLSRLEDVLEHFRGRALINVDFPDPTAPVIPIISPRFASKQMSFKTSLSAYEK